MRVSHVPKITSFGKISCIYYTGSKISERGKGEGEFYGHTVSSEFVIYNEGRVLMTELVF